MALDPAAYPEIFDGPKDNVLVQPGWSLSYITTFGDFGVPAADTMDARNSYMYHCHILPHEDMGMMGTFVVWDGVTSVDEEDLPEMLMEVSPNPAQDIVNMKGSSNKVSTLQFLSMDGRLIKKMTLPAFDGTIQIEVDDLPGGMMIMNWQTEEGSANRKVMIAR